jgi:hypothetical protein
MVISDDEVVSNRLLRGLVLLLLASVLKPESATGLLLDDDAIMADAVG